MNLETYKKYVKKFDKHLKGSIAEGSKEIGQTILQQLGGNKFIVMTGAKNIGFTNKGIQMGIGRNAKGVTHLIINYNKGKDLYDMEFIKIRGIDRTVVKDLKGVYADQLQKLFTKYTGMHTRL